MSAEEPRSPDTPDADLPQDPAIPGWDVMSDPTDKPIPDDKDESAEDRERHEDPDQEGHMTAPEE